MKRHPIRLLLVTCALLLPALARSQVFPEPDSVAVMQDPDTDAVTSDIVMPAGKTLTLSGTLTGTPTGGTLDLGNLTLTLPTVQPINTAQISELAGENGETVLELTDQDSPSAAGDWDWLSGSSITMSSGTVMAINGTLNGTPTGGTLDLSNLTLAGEWTLDEILTAGGLVTENTVRAGTELIIGSSGSTANDIVLDGSGITFEGATADTYETILRAQDPEVDTVLLLPSGAEYDGIRIATMVDVEDGDSTVNTRVTGLADDPASDGDLNVGNWRTVLNVEPGATADQTDAEILAAWESESGRDASADGAAIDALATTYQPLDADLTDLAEDGELPGSKVGPDITADNITLGTLDPARLGSGSALQVLRRNAANNALEFVDASGGGGDVLQSDIDTIGELNAILGDATVLDASVILANNLRDNSHGFAISNGTTTDRAERVQYGEAGDVAGLPVTIVSEFIAPSSDPTQTAYILSFNAGVSAFSAHAFVINVLTTGDLQVSATSGSTSVDDRRNLIYPDFVDDYGGQPIRLSVSFPEGDSTTAPTIYINGEDKTSSFALTTGAGTVPNWMSADLDTTYFLTGYNWPAGRAPYTRVIVGTLSDTQATDYTGGTSLEQAAPWTAQAGSALTSHSKDLSEDFDDGSTGSYWITDDSGGSSATVQAVETYGGSAYALELDVLDGTSGNARLIASNDLTIGAEYYLLFRAKHAGSGFKLALGDYASGGRYEGEINLTAAWVQYAVRFTAATDDLIIGRRFDNFNDNKTAYIDDIRLIDRGPLDRPIYQPGSTTVADGLGRFERTLVGMETITNRDPRSWTIDSTGDLTSSSQANLTGGAASTNTTTGDIVTTGGAGIGGDINAGGSIAPSGNAATWTTGSGTPEGSVTAVVGSIYTRTDGGADTTLYIKESGSGNTGWVAK